MKQLACVGSLELPERNAGFRPIDLKFCLAAITKVKNNYRKIYFFFGASGFKILVKSTTLNLCFNEKCAKILVRNFITPLLKPMILFSLLLSNVIGVEYWNMIWEELIETVRNSTKISTECPIPATLLTYIAFPILMFQQIGFSVFFSTPIFRRRARFSSTIRK